MSDEALRLSMVHRKIGKNQESISSKRLSAMIRKVMFFKPLPDTGHRASYSKTVGGCISHLSVTVIKTSSQKTTQRRKDSFCLVISKGWSPSCQGWHSVVAGTGTGVSKHRRQRSKMKLQTIRAHLASFLQ